MITAARTSLTVSPVYIARPVSISAKTTPKAQMSARLSTVFPRACSGDMYAAVPMITPACVARMVSVGESAGLSPEAGSFDSAFASPKSSTLAWPSAESLILAGFRSRWTTPFS